jgi:predicted O-methyltransferase YrrM
MERSSLIDVVFGFMPARAVSAAAELGVADLLASGPQTSDELAEKAGAHAPSLRRLLRYLASLGVVAQIEPDRFELTELGATLRTDVPDSVRSFVAMACSDWSWKCWGELATSIRTGELGVHRALGMPLFDWLEQNPEEGTLFNEAMSDMTRTVAPAVVANYDFSQFRKVVDVGGGNGTLAAAILQAVPDLEAVVFDLPGAMESAVPVLEAAGVTDRCQTVGGDFFDSVPEGGDAYVMKMVLHDWDDEKAVAILRNCRKAMADGGKVLLVERVLPEMVTEKTAETLMIDLFMLIALGGRERTAAEFGQLLAQADLELTRVIEGVTPPGDAIIEAVPA